VSRKLKSEQFTTELPGAEGIIFRDAIRDFIRQQKTPAVETVAFMREKDGQ